jgi:uncharacterized protein YfiM (DUF2279 family)
VLGIVIAGCVPAQDSSAYAPGQARSVANCQRTAAWVGGSLWGGAYILLDRAWYAQFERTSFHGFNDGREWLQMDKAGHAFSAYTLGAWGHGLLRHCGASEARSRWAGGALGLAFLSGIEVLDGFSAGWGFSPWDMAANTGGAGLFIVQDALWGEQRVRLKLSAHLTDFAARRPDLLGSSFAERLLKDYNGQTYWASVDVARFGAGPGRWPRWLMPSVGYGATGMVAAFPDEQPMAVAAQRRFFLSLDTDLRRVRTRSRFVRAVLTVLSSIKVPAPTLELRSDGTLLGHWLYF